MIVNQADAAPVIPVLPESFFEAIHNISMYLLLDDAHDLGRFSYYQRGDYYYHGRHSPNHPSPVHHWQLAIFGLLFSNIGSVVMKGAEMFRDYKRIESGDFSDLDQDIIDLVEDDSSVSLLDYEQEVKTIQPVKDLSVVSSYSAQREHLSSLKNHSKSLQKNPLKLPRITYLPVSSR